MDEYLEKYSEDYDVDIETVIKTIKIANTFDIWYPENPKAKRTWQEALEDFKEYYVNSAQSGYEYLHDFTGIENPHVYHDENIADCPWCAKMVKVNQEDGVITLDRFFQ